MSNGDNKFYYIQLWMANLRNRMTWYKRTAVKLFRAIINNYELCNAKVCHYNGYHHRHPYI